VEKLRGYTEIAERGQIINVLDFVNGLLVGAPIRDKFQHYARSLLRPTFDSLGWESKEGEPPTAGSLRASLINALGELNDREIIDVCCERFGKYLANAASLAPALRPPVFSVVPRYGASPPWTNILPLLLNTPPIHNTPHHPP